MAKYYECFLLMQNIHDAFLDYYGAYDASSNPNGVTIHASTTSLLIFSCPAISDKVIKFTGTSDMRAYYGDAYDSGANDITNPIEWGGSSTAGSTSGVYVCLADSTVLIVTLANITNCRVWLIGKLTNSKFLVQGLIGISAYRADALGRITDGSIGCMPHGLSGDYSVEGKVAKSPLVFVTASGAEMNGSEIATLTDVYSVSRQVGVTICYKGTDYFLSPSGLYNANGELLYNSIVMEGITN